MKKHLRLILMAIIAMIVPLALHAQQDVTTTYLVNPGFEEGPGFFHDSSQVVPGWKISKPNLMNAFRNTNDGTTPPEGLNVFGVWSPGTVADFQIAQTVRNLPVGTYTISCVMMTYSGEYTTQRMFVSTPSAGTKALYYESTPLDTIDGESYSFANYPDDGTGNGPFRPMQLKIKVAAGDSLTFGVRMNGTLSTISPQLAALGKNGHFKVDNFKLNFIPDDVAFTKTLIQEKINLVKEIRTDTVPMGYIPVIAAKIVWGDATILSQTNQDSLDACLVNFDVFLASMKVAKTKYLNLGILMRTCEKLTAEWPMSGLETLNGFFDKALETFYSPTALNADFDKAYKELDLAIVAYSIGRIPENLALKAKLSTSFVSSWEKLAAIVDGYEPKNSRDKGLGAYGNWDGSSGKTQWVQLEWPTYMNFNRFDVYWWYDGSEPDNGGISRPLWAKLEYFKDGAWVLASEADTAVNKWTKNPFVYKTNKIRISMAGTIATGILEVRAMGLGKAGPDVSDYKMLINDELIVINAINADSIPKGYAPTTTTLKDQAAVLLAGTDSLGLMNNYTALKAQRVLLEAGKVSFKNLTTTLSTANVAIGASVSTVIKPKLQSLYDNGLAVLMSATSMNDTINKTNTALTTYLSSNTRLVSAKVSLDNTTNAARKTAYQYAYDRALNIFLAPKIDSVAFYTTSLYATQRLSDTLQVAEIKMEATSYLGEDTLMIAYNASLATMLSLTNVAATLNTARTNLSAALLKYNKNVGLGIAQINKHNDFVNVYPSSVKRGSMITIDFSKALAKPASVELFMVSGQRVFKTSVYDKTSSVKVPVSMASGIYLMVFESPEGKTFKKIVVE